jgi:hypothetical protein
MVFLNDNNAWEGREANRAGHVWVKSRGDKRKALICGEIFGSHHSLGSHKGFKWLNVFRV